MATGRFLRASQPFQGWSCGASLAGPLLDLGAETGLWSDRLARWLAATAIAVEPASARLMVGGFDRGIAHARVGQSTA